MRVRSSLTDAVCVLADAAVEGGPPHWADGMQVLAALDAREWIAASDYARSHYAALTGVLRRWEALDLTEPTGFVAVLASWHANGYIREKAVRHALRVTALAHAAGLALRAMPPPLR